MRRSVVFLIAAALSSAATALDFRSVGEATILFDAPSHKSRPLFAIAAGTPVEAIVTLDNWVKVRDMKGDLSWIERRVLSERRNLQVRAETAQVREKPDESARLVFEAETDVVLELVEAGTAGSPGWVRVRHRDGQQGFVKTAQVWGF